MKYLQSMLTAGCGLLLSVYVTAAGTAYRLRFTTNSHTGALSNLTIDGDSRQMNWLQKTDGSQYTWITARYGWGLGYLTTVEGTDSVKQQWQTPVSLSKDGLKVTYQTGSVRINVVRNVQKNGLTEVYTFNNTGKKAISLADIGIFTPLNDNYPDAVTCISRRTDVQVWDGGSAAYINALRMGAFAPHLGVVVTKGAVKSYEIWARGIDRANSQTRGIIALNLPDMTLKAGQHYTVSWTIFPHNGNTDFKKRLLEEGSVQVSCNKYVFQKGEKAVVTLRSGHSLNGCRAFLNGISVPVRKKGHTYQVETIMNEPGEARFEFLYDGGKRTHADCLVHEDFNKLIQKRVDFIRTRQQMTDTADLRYGAYMVYDNEGDSIYLNNTHNCSPADRDEGAERTGMGILLAKQYLLTKEPALKESLLKYADFFRNRLQTPDFKTFSSVDRKGRNRGYNYMWAADFYFLMYHVTGDRKYASYGYETLQAMFRQFGYGFYAIDIPVSRGLQTLKAAGMTKEYDKLLEDFYKTGDIFIKNGLNYPRHEVNYEQSIVAPAIQFLLELYLETGRQKYLNEARRQMPVLEAFNGFQPSFHLNDIAIRHWDGFWFGKRELFGDTFPHYWSTITAGVFHLYACATGQTAYQQRAENIVRNNLCLFFENGKASCAYLYPYKVDGVKGKFYDPYANDQDFALAYYMLVMHGL